MNLVRPVRIQRLRTKGFRLQDASPNGLPVIYVGRPSIWGNRYKVGTWSNSLGRHVETIEEAIRLYRNIIWAAPDAPHMTAYVRECLRGKNLACWCPLVDKDGNRAPCHADVLLELANA